MALANRNPYTIHLGGRITQDDRHTASTTITPGFLIELFDNAGTLQWRPHGLATRQATVSVALEQTYLNLSITDDYSASDQVLAGHFGSGSQFYGIVVSGEDITQGDYLQSNGDGKLKEATSSAAGDNVARFQALETLGSIAADTRVRVQVL